MLDFDDISIALNTSSQIERLGECKKVSSEQPNLYEQNGIRLRRYNSKTGDFTSAMNSSDDDSDNEFQHEMVLR